jgi:hypothetical protein
MPQSGGLLLETVYYVVALMSLFDLSRVWEAWPQLTGSQVLRGLFQQAPIHSAVEEVRRVFMTRSHLFVASETHELGTAWTVPLANSPDDRRSHTGGDRLYAFSSSGGGDERDCCLPLEAGGGQVVSVACVAGCEDEVLANSVTLLTPACVPAPSTHPATLLCTALQLATPTRSCCAVTS